jgi:integrase
LRHLTAGLFGIRTLAATVEMSRIHRGDAMMGRQAKLGRKAGYWYSEAGGKARRFGRIGIVSYREALARFRAALAETPDAGASDGPGVLTMATLAERYLAWVGTHRSHVHQDGQTRHIKRFLDHVGKDFRATEVKTEQLDTFRAALAKRYPPSYVKKHEVSLRTMFRRGVRMGWLPDGFNPFGAVEPIRLALSPLLETDLPTAEEVRAMLSLPGPLGALLTIYHATGARTAELVYATVGDYQPATGQLVLGRHKRSATMKDPVPRIIVLSPAARTLVETLCQGRKPSCPIFTRKNGKSWSVTMIAHQLATARRQRGIRESITVYSLRHLWISDALMAGLDALLVARMAGTSLAMVERVYGHFRCQSFQDAQARLDAMRSGWAD